MIRKTVGRDLTNLTTNPTLLTLSSLTVSPLPKAEGLQPPFPSAIQVTPVLMRLQEARPPSFIARAESRNSACLIHPQMVRTTAFNILCPSY